MARVCKENPGEERQGGETKWEGLTHSHLLTLCTLEDKSVTEVEWQVPTSEKSYYITFA